MFPNEDDHGSTGESYSDEIAKAARPVTEYPNLPYGFSHARPEGPFALRAAGNSLNQITGGGLAGDQIITLLGQSRAGSGVGSSGGLNEQQVRELFYRMQLGQRSKNRKAAW